MVVHVNNLVTQEEEVGGLCLRLAWAEKVRPFVKTN
jgi:hypothetical protein